MSDDRKYYGQQCQDEKLNIAFRNFHKNIIDDVLGFCRAYGITIDEFHLSMDNMGESIKAGKWVPASDSSLTFYKFDDKEKSKRVQEPYLFSI